MKKCVFIILAVVLLTFLISISIQAYERPPGQEGLRVDDRYEGSHWSDIDGAPSPDNGSGDIANFNSDLKEPSINNIWGNYSNIIVSWIMRVFENGRVSSNNIIRTGERTPPK